MSSHSLDKLFNPQSIAIVGASASPAKAGYQMLNAIRDFKGGIYPINPKAEELLGHRAYPSLKSVGQPIDLAILTLPAALCFAATLDAVEAGVGAIMIISGGFAETGEQGQQLQNGILQLCRDNNIRLLGPNTSGFALPAEGLAISFAPGMDVLRPGPVAVISQSGAINLTMTALAAEHNLGVRLAVGIGNGQDVSSASLIDYLADDPETKLIACYLEGVSNGRQLFDAVAKATHSKPVVIFTVGKADVGEFAASHTGNLIGSFQLKKSALEQAGAVVVESTNEMMDAAKLLSAVRLEPNADPGIALLTGQAGPGMIISDYLRWHGVSMPELDTASVERIGKLLPPMTYFKNPVDTGRPGETFGPVLQAVADDPNIDAILAFALHEPAAIEPTKLFSENRQGISQPLIFGTAGIPESITPTVSALDEMGIPAFTSPDRAARATWALAMDARAAHRRLSAPATGEVRADMPVAGALDEAQGKALLVKLGIGVPESAVCTNSAEAQAAFERLPKPLVVKVLAAEILHKTEVGGVHVNIDTQQKLHGALDAIDGIEVAGDTRYLIEPMAPAGLEIIVGGTNDVSFGPTILVGLGGTAAEALEDVAIRVAPLSENDAMEMLDELRGKALFEGWRGAPALDKQALAKALVNLGNFLYRHPEIREIDLNPVRVYADGLLALDALIVV